MEAKLFDGDLNVPGDYLDGQVIISNRRSNVSKNEVWEYYNDSQDSLLAQGWKLQQATHSTNDHNFVAEYEKGSRRLYITLFNTVSRSMEGNPVLAGYRLEIYYK